MDYYPLRNTNQELPEQEKGDKEEASAPVVDIIVNDLRKNEETQVLAVQITNTLHRMKYAV
jgi:hypothetical protein